MNNQLFTTIPPELDHHVILTPDEEFEDWIREHCPIPTDEELSLLEKEVWEQ